MKKQMTNQKGITLIALVITIIILLILAGVTISLTIGQNGILRHATKAVEENTKATAREKLEVTFGGAKIEKASNPDYNQDDYLDGIIRDEIANVEILEDVVIVDGWAFEIDRSVPKIGEAIGKKDELIFPKIEIIEQPELVDDGESAKFKIRATVAGGQKIKKIELCMSGTTVESIDLYGEKSEEVAEFKVSENGTYTVKAYADYASKENILVTGIIKLNKAPTLGDVKFEKDIDEESGNWFQIETSSSDVEGDLLTYSFKVWKKEGQISESDLMKEIPTKTETKDNVLSGENVKLKIDGLEEYTDYVWIIEVDDGENTVINTPAIVRTYCPGTGLKCRGREVCVTCGGDGVHETKSLDNNSWQSYESYYTCWCGRRWFIGSKGV